jgi:hypothetical protein
MVTSRKKGQVGKLMDNFERIHKREALSWAHMLRAAKAGTVVTRWTGKDGFKAFYADMQAKPKGARLRLKAGEVTWGPSTTYWARGKDQSLAEKLTRQTTNLEGKGV